MGRGLQPAFTVPTCVYGGFARYTRGNINGETKAVSAERICGGCAIDGGATLTAENAVNSLVTVEIVGKYVDLRRSSLGNERTLREADWSIHI